MVLHVPPFDLHDAMQQAHYLHHATLTNEGIDPSDGLIPQQQPELVDLANLDFFGLLYLP